MSQGGRKPRPSAEQDDTFDAKTVIRPNPARADFGDDDEDAGDEKTKLGSPLEQAFGERTMVMPSRSAGIPQPPPPPPRPAPEARMPQPPPRASQTRKTEPKSEEKLELSEETQWNSQVDVTNPGMEPIEKRSFAEIVASVRKNARIVGGALIFLVAVFVITRFAGRGDGEAVLHDDSEVRPPAVEHSAPRWADNKPKPAVTPPQHQPMGSDGGVPVETVLQQFDQAFFSIQSQARGQ